MPVLAVMAHLTLIHANCFTAIITVFGKHGIEADQAIGFAFAHYVTLAAQLLLALMTSEMVHMPSSTLSFRTFVGQNDLQILQKEKKC